MAKKQLFAQLLIMSFLVTLMLISFNVITQKYKYEFVQHFKRNPDENVNNYQRTNNDNLQDDIDFHNDDESVAIKLRQQVRVLIAIITAPKNLKERAQAVKDTWAKRCDKIVYFSTEENKDFPTIGLKVPEGYDHLTAKTMTSFSYIYQHFFNDYDWFMKADDDTYIILENLRYFLSEKNTSEPVYFGHHFKPYIKQGYHGGGAGYVLSKEALRRFGEKGNNSDCHSDGGAEDVEMGRCLESVGVRIVNSDDSLGRSRFHSFIPESYLKGTFPKWYYHYDVNGAKQGRGNISDYVISFHSVNPEKMRQLEFYVYHLRPYGINNGQQDLNTNITERSR